MSAALLYVRKWNVALCTRPHGRVEVEYDLIKIRFINNEMDM